MRLITEEERAKRGCSYCADAQVKMKNRKRRRVCPYWECPYHELDAFKSYGEFMKTKTTSMTILLRNLGLEPQ